MKIMSFEIKNEEIIHGELNMVPMYLVDNYCK